MCSISLEEEVAALRWDDELSPAPAWLRLLGRSLAVLAATGAALAVPDIAALLGLAGGLSLPLSIALPLACWSALRRPHGWRRAALLALSAVALLACLAAAVGSVRTLIVAWESFSLT